MSQLTTTTGQASESVTIEYDVDCDGYVQEMAIMFKGVDVIGLLTEEHVNELENQCFTAYLQKSAELRTEAAISRHESRRDDAACEGMA